jgi:ABC-type branched-subunit amino acid transport system ATPase component
MVLSYSAGCRAVADRRSVLAQRPDPHHGDRLAEVLAGRRRRDGIALLIVEQHLPFALGIADRYAVLKRGEIIASGRVTGDAAHAIEEHMQI